MSRPKSRESAAEADSIIFKVEVCFDGGEEMLAGLLVRKQTSPYDRAYSYNRPYFAPDLNFFYRLEDD